MAPIDWTLLRQKKYSKYFSRMGEMAFSPDRRPKGVARGIQRIYTESLSNESDGLIFRGILHHTQSHLHHSSSGVKFYYVLFSQDDSLRSSAWAKSHLSPSGEENILVNAALEKSEL
ncbi:MAG: hypothetical protein JWO53_985 [Chlamydiia bacterium]|nr:hypothetical protein [Chlamydiia bacterium]